MTEQFFQERLAAMRQLEQRAIEIVRLVEAAAMITMVIVWTILHIEDELTGTSLGLVGAVCIFSGVVGGRAVGSFVRQHYAERIERDYPLWDGEGRRVDVGEWP